MVPSIRHRFILSFSLILSMSFSSTSFAQTENVGTDICGCQPATYTFQFDFDLTCDETTNISENANGVNQTACLTAVRGRQMAPADEKIPVAIQNVQIFELDASLRVAAQTVRPGVFRDGDTFTYTSILSTADSTTVQPPRGLQLVMTALNEDEESVVNTFIVTYTNDCGIFPVLQEGQTAGWVVLTDLGDPPNPFCPLAPAAPTLPPSLAPDEETPSPMTTPISPTSSPVDPTPSPTVAPAVVVIPTRPPSCVVGGKGKGSVPYDDKYATDPESEASGKGGKGGKGEAEGKGGGKGEAKGKGRARKKKSKEGKGKGEKRDGKGMMMMLGDDRRALGVHGGGGTDECDEEDEAYGGTDSSDAEEGKGKGKGYRQRKMMKMSK